MSKSSKDFRINRIVQARPVKKSEKTVSPVGQAGTKTTTSKKGQRVTARKKRVSPQEKAGNKSKPRSMLPNPSTVEPMIAKNLPNRKKRSSRSKPSPFGAASVHANKKNVRSITLIDGAQLRKTRISVPYKPVSHKKITLG
jgi:hypothetical protein